MKQKEHGTEQKLFARALTTEEVSYCCRRSMPCQSSPRTGLRRCNTYTEQKIARTWHRCSRQRFTQSVFLVRKFRTDSGFIVQDTKERTPHYRNQHLTRLDTNRQKSKLYHFHVHTYQNKYSRTVVSQGCKTGLDHRSTVEGRSREVQYCTLLVASKRTSSDFYGKRTNFSFDKAENTRQCTST